MRHGLRVAIVIAVFTLGMVAEPFTVEAREVIAGRWRDIGCVWDGRPMTVIAAVPDEFDPAQYAGQLLLRERNGRIRMLTRCVEVRK